MQLRVHAIRDLEPMAMAGKPDKAELHTVPPFIIKLYEIVDSRGEVRTVTAASDPALFYALPWSHGTLGFLAALKVKGVRDLLQLEGVQGQVDAGATRVLRWRAPSWSPCTRSSRGLCRR